MKYPVVAVYQDEKGATVRVTVRDRRQLLTVIEASVSLGESVTIGPYDGVVVRRSRRAEDRFVGTDADIRVQRPNR